MIFIDFIYLLRDYGILVGLQEVLDFYKGLEKGMVASLDELFLYARLVFVKRVEHLDRFERAFSLFFFNVDLPRVVEGDPELFGTKQFREWLEQAVATGKIPRTAIWSMSREDLMKMFWDRVKEQKKAHHGGNRWIGTGGSSPFGHSGFSQNGIRVYGGSRNRSARKVIGERRYVSYDSGNTLKGENMRQVLASLRHMVPVGPDSELDLDETVYRTGKNGGDIELVFKRQELDKIRLLLLIDNGGSSMMPFVALTRLLFSKVRNQFKDCTTYYFHNTIYNCVYKDERRRMPLPMEELLRFSPETRLFIVGDASMAPGELFESYGALDFDKEDRVPSLERLAAIRDRFKYTVWLNPIPSEEWDRTYGSWTLQKIRGIFHMEDLTLQGIKNAVTHLRRLVPS